MRLSLAEWLALNVPSEIEAIKKRGGLNDHDLMWLQQTENDDPNDFCILNVLLRADSLILFPTDSFNHKSAILVFRKAIALMSFFPGGVRLFGYHFCSEIIGYVSKED